MLCVVYFPSTLNPPVSERHWDVGPGPIKHLESSRWGIDNNSSSSPIQYREGGGQIGVRSGPNRPNHIQCYTWSYCSNTYPVGRLIEKKRPPIQVDVSASLRQRPTINPQVRRGVYAARDEDRIYIVANIRHDKYRFFMR